MCVNQIYSPCLSDLFINKKLILHFCPINKTLKIKLSIFFNKIFGIEKVKIAGKFT